MKLIKQLLVLVLAFSLAGCQKQTNTDSQTLTISENGLGNTYYPVLKADNGATTRVKTYNYLNDYDLVEVGRGLQLLSMDPFSVKDSYIREGQIITNDDLKLLLKRYNNDPKAANYNPYGLNQPKGEKLQTLDGEVTDPVLVDHIIEQDFLTVKDNKAKIKGLSFAIVLDKYQDVVDKNGFEAEYEVDDAYLLDYGKKQVKLLLDYLKNEKGIKDIPIFVTLYTTNSRNVSIPGHFLAKVNFNNNKLQDYKMIDEKYYIAPSPALKQVDVDLYNAFESFSNNIQKFSEDNVGSIAKIKFVDNKATHMEIDLTINALTYTEAIGFVQNLLSYAKQLPTGVDTIIKINSQDQMIAVVERKFDESDFETTFLN